MNKLRGDFEKSCGEKHLRDVFQIVEAQPTWAYVCHLEEKIHQLYKELNTTPQSTPLICECGDHVDGRLHLHKDGKTYCEMCG